MPCSKQARRNRSPCSNVWHTAWHVLTKQVADCHSDPVRVARKLLRWAQTRGTASRLGLPRLTFVRAYLDRLQLGQEFTTLEAGSTIYTLPPSQISSA